MDYNKNWSNEISGVDVVDKKGKDIIGVKEVDIRNIAIEYLNKEENRRLPPHEFNLLVSRVKEYLTKVDNERGQIEHKFEGLKRGIVAEIRASKNTLRREIDSRNIDEISKIRNPGDLSRYIDQSGDKALIILKKELGAENILSLAGLGLSYGTIELGRGLADVLKLGEEFVKAYDDLKNGDFMAKDKIKLIFKTLGIEGLRLLCVIPGGKLILVKIGQFTKEINIGKILKPLNNNKGSVSLRGSIDISKESEEVYSKYPVLKKHQEFLGKLEHKDILGTGQNAIIVRHPTNEKMVVKVAKEGKVDNIEMEYGNHQKFFDTLQDGITEYRGKIDEKIRIPGIKRVGNQEGIFVMEKIEGQNLATKFYREQYSKELSKYSKSYLDGLNDKQFELLMDKEKLRKVPIMQLEGDFSGRILSKQMKEYFNKHTHGTELGNTLDFLEWKGLRHNDLHPGNIMIDNKGNIYIIDFGRVLIRK